MSRTSIVYNNPNKVLGLPPFYYRARSCDTNLTSNTPANRYQRLKLIQHTVRVDGSLYTSNVGPLAAYQNPGPRTNFVCWNQMSDRVYPSVQKATIPTGTNCTLNRRTTSVTSSRPGTQTPGGVGCDIKHNSYDRYLNRLKGKGALRRGPIPPDFAAPEIPFNVAYPVYGGKTMKTNIVTGCDCPIDAKPETKPEAKIYDNPLFQPYPDSEFSFNIGDSVFAIQKGDQYYTRALVQHKYNNLTYVIEFDNGTTEIQDIHSLLIYYPCNCNGTINSNVYPSGFLVTNPLSSDFNPTCLYPTYLPGEPVL